MLSVHTIQPGEFQSELASAWMRGVKEVVNDVIVKFEEWGACNGDKQTVKNVFVGRDAFLQVRNTIKAAQKETKTYREEMWGIIAPAFKAPKLEDHPLLTGKHD